VLTVSVVCQKHICIHSIRDYWQLCYIRPLAYLLMSNHGDEQLTDLENNNREGRWVHLPDVVLHT